MRLPLCVAALILSAALAAAQAPDAKTPPALRLRIASAVPVTGVAQPIQAMAEWRGVDFAGTLEIACERNGVRARIGTPMPVALTGTAKSALLKAEWTPEAEGDARLVALLTAADGKPLVATQDIAVVGRTLNFHYWDLQPELRYVTQGLLRTKDYGRADYWQDRGVMVQRWLAGELAYKNDNRRTVDEIVAYWTREPDKWPCRVIDEFMTGGEIDEMLGVSLLRAREVAPGLRFAAYTNTISGENKIRGLREGADIVLVEVYEGDAARGYPIIERRTQSAVDAGLQAKLLCILGLGRDWIMTPQEMRRQFHYVRYRFPDLAGIGFFGTTPHLYPAINDLVAAFFIGPVLRAETTADGKVLVRNIGGRRSPATRVAFRAPGAPQATLAVPALAAGAEFTAAAPMRDAAAQTEYRADCLVLGAPQLWDREPAELRPGATTPLPTIPAHAKPLASESFDTAPALQLAEGTADNRGKKHKSLTATREIAAPGGADLDWTFDLSVDSIGMYSVAEVGLASADGSSSISIRIRRDEGVPTPYAQIAAVFSNKIVVRERLALPLTPGDYRVRVRCQAGKGLRAVVARADGKAQWDTGLVPAYGAWSLDRFFLSSIAQKSTLVEWDAATRSLSARGQSADEPALGVRIDNLRIYSPLP